MQAVSVPNYAAIEAAVESIRISLISSGQHVCYEVMATELQRPEHAAALSILRGASLESVPVMQHLRQLDQDVTAFIQGYVSVRLV